MYSILSLYSLFLSPPSTLSLSLCLSFSRLYYLIRLKNQRDRLIHGDQRDVGFESYRREQRKCLSVAFQIIDVIFITIGG